MENLAHALAREELVRVLTVYSGVATADGAPGGTTIVDSNLIGVNDFISKKTVLIGSGPAALEDKGAASFNNVTGTITLQGAFSSQITEGTIYRVLNISSVEVDVAYIHAKLGITTYTARSAGATDVDGTTWKNLLNVVLTHPEEIWGITLTVAGGWAGLCKYRIVRADTLAKIFPFGTECIQNTDFVSGIPVNYPAPVVVPATIGYIVQFRSTNGGDGAGQTCALTELAVIERG